MLKLKIEYNKRFFRFGETRCLVANKNIDKGEEILLNYNYNMKNFVPEWYKKLYIKTYGIK